LANTGATEILWVAASGLALLLTGGLGRRLILRRVR
jgi:LPXTG-motif cell wall-anchored protein